MRVQEVTILHWPEGGNRPRASAECDILHRVGAGPAMDRGRWPPCGAVAEKGPLGLPPGLKIFFFCFVPGGGRAALAFARRGQLALRTWQRERAVRAAVRGAVVSMQQGLPERGARRRASE